MFNELLTLDAAVALLTLTLMETVLGIDNVVFLSILAGKLPQEQQPKARKVGLAMALLMRIALLLAINWVTRLTTPLIWRFSGRDLIMLGGGLFLMGKATHEIYDKLEGGHEDKVASGTASFGWTVAQIAILDAVFSLDSVITAIGMAQQLPIMIAAVVISIVIMLVFSGAISRFIEKHPSMKILALSFLLLIGFMLAADGLGEHIPKGYIYAAMAFSILVELLNMRYRAKQKPVTLHHAFEKPADSE